MLLEHDRKSIQKCTLHLLCSFQVNPSCHLTLPYIDLDQHINNIPAVFPFGDPL